ncbi:N-acetyllactosaminide beta-1,6-N-acetylglucosaminyl-transferase-like [Glandiceps talaboti]
MLVISLSLSLALNVVIYVAHDQNERSTGRTSEGKQINRYSSPVQPKQMSSHNGFKQVYGIKNRKTRHGETHNITYVSLEDKMSRLFRPQEDITSINTSQADKICMEGLRRQLWDSHEQARQVKIQLMEGRIKDSEFVEKTKNCTDFAVKHGYFSTVIDNVEEEFPLAFVISMYRSVGQVEQLLRTIYRPQNVYCIHVDKKAKDEVHVAIKAISSCFDNIFVVSRPTKVTWCSVEVLHAEILCMKILLEQGRNWKYYINLAGQDFPLKTNKEIVQILNVFNGKNDISSFKDARFDTRQQYAYRQVNDNVRKSEIPKAPPPGNLTIYKGELHAALSRKFVEFVLESNTSLNLYDWLRDTECPDEHFIQSLNRLPQAPGGFVHNAMTISRAKIWNNVEICNGKTVRGVCVFGTGDLPWLVRQPHLFANKFNIDFDPLPTYCLEKYLKGKALYPRPLNLHVYRRFVSKRLIDSTTMKWTSDLAL